MPERLGKYRLLRRLAMGGMAEIWLARQEGLHGFEKLLVIKRILPHLAENPEFVRMFLDEARLAAQLSHPNIVQIFDLGEENGAYFIAMEHIHGENLRTISRRLSRNGDARLPPALAAKILSQAAAALHYAHERRDLSGRPLNIVHRDVSPQNLLLGYDGVVKVVDFGIAKAATQFAETRTGVLKGKYAYMSPEQTVGEKLDARSDVFALGVVLWELLTGRRLYSRKSDLLVLKAISEEPPVPPRQIVPELSEDLEAIVLKALAKSREDRFASAEAFHEALEDFLFRGGERITEKTLSGFMHEIFPDRLEQWSALLASSRAEEVDLDDPIFDEEAALLEAGTPSASQRSAPPGAWRGVSGTGPSSASPVRIDGVAPAGTTTTPATAQARASAKRWPLWLGLGATVLVLGGAAALVLSGAPGSQPDATVGLPKASVALSVRSTPPGATVEVAGVPLASKTPLRTRLDPTGETVPVRILAEGYLPEARTLTLEPGTKVAWEVVLRPRPEAKPKAEARPAGAGPGAATAASPPVSGAAGAGGGSVHEAPKASDGRGRKASVSPRPGTLTFDARPWCRLSVDGKDRGVTPFARLPLRPGKHRLVCTHPKLGSRRLTVSIRSGRETREVVTLGKGKVKLLIRPWATVFLDGKKIGQTPFPPVEVEAGVHHLLLVNEDLHVRRERSVEVRPGRTLRVEETLK